MTTGDGVLLTVAGGGVIMFLALLITGLPPLPTGTRVTATLAAAEGDAARVAYGAACKLYVELCKTCGNAL